MTLSSPPFSSASRCRRTTRRPSISPLRLGSITESPEYDECIGLNLGTESPASILKPAIEGRDGSEDEWGKSGIAVHTDVPMRRRSWRSASFSEKRKLRGRPLVKDAVVVDRDCGICFGVAVAPCKMICCGNVFCLAHISDWLYGSSSDGRCPSCRELCSFVQELPSHPVDDKRIDWAPHPKSQNSERAFILLLLQPSESKPSSVPMGSSVSSDPDPNASPCHSGSRADRQKLPVMARTTAGSGSPPPDLDLHHDFQVLGPCRCYLSSTLAVLVGHMIGRVLSVVGLTLVLFVLLT